MNARAVPVIAASLSLGSWACADVAQYHPRVAQIGAPAHPPTRLESVTTAHNVPLPGVHRPGIVVGAYTRPVVTREGLQDTGEVAISEARVISIAVRIQTSQPTEVVNMTWTTPDGPRCSGGHPSLRVSVDDQGHWERPLVVAGEHVVSSRFDEDRPLLETTSVLDVLLVEQNERRQQTCVRVPVTSAGASFSQARPWSLASRVSWRSSLPFMSGDAWAFGLSVGRWVGPVRLGIEYLVGGSNDQPNPANSVNIRAPALEASGIAWRWNRWALGWSLAYEILLANVHRTPAAGGPQVDSRAVSGGPRLALQLLRVPDWILGVPRWHAHTYLGVELFGAAAALAPRGPSGGAQLAWGLSLVAGI
jgi:hypothetical protein